MSDLEEVEAIIANDKTLEEGAKPENTRLCECGKPTISPSSPLCPTCMAARANAKRKSSPPEKGKPKGRAKTKRLDGKKGKGVETASPTSILVEFNEYEEILERITEESRNQVRTVAGQIIWILKNSVGEQGERREQ